MTESASHRRVAAPEEGSEQNRKPAEPALKRDLRHLANQFMSYQSGGFV